MKHMILGPVIACGASLALLAGSTAPPQSPRDLELLPRVILEQRLSRAPKSNSDREAVLRRMFEEAGCTGAKLTEQPIERGMPPNLVCTLSGTTDAQIIVGAHFDKAKSGNGIVDDWSGAALLPSLRQTLGVVPRRHTFIFVAFSEEERGLAGSRFYAQSMGPGEVRKIRAMINLECLGLGPATFWSRQADPVLKQHLFDLADGLGILIEGLDLQQIRGGDSEAFAARGIPTLTIHSVTEETWPILHSSRDNLKSMNLDDYYESYRLIAAYLCFIDSTLDVNEPPKAPPSQ